MEMLKSMKQEMKERDNELRIQLRLKDEYMDVELRRSESEYEGCIETKR